MDGHELGENELKSIEIVCVLDRSGSMQGLHEDSVGAFNQYIDEQRKSGIKAKVTLAVFDTEYEVLRDRVKLDNLEPMKAEESPPRGGTALNDAMGRALTNAKQDKPTIVLVMTDGGENSSVEYTTEKVKKLVQEKEKEGWKFQFFGAGIDAFSVGGGYGMSRKSYINVTADAQGMVTRSQVMSTATVDFASAVNSSEDD
jgi:Mg-chelatase subunit ChlD